jgi:hypothetical protein
VHPDDVDRLAQTAANVALTLAWSQ